MPGALFRSVRRRPAGRRGRVDGGALRPSPGPAGLRSGRLGGRGRASCAPGSRASEPAGSQPSLGVPESPPPTGVTGPRGRPFCCVSTSLVPLCVLFPGRWPRPVTETSLSAEGLVFVLLETAPETHRRSGRGCGPPPCEDSAVSGPDVGRWWSEGGSYRGEAPPHIKTMSAPQTALGAPLKKQKQN